MKFFCQAMFRCPPPRQTMQSWGGCAGLSIIARHQGCVFSHGRTRACGRTVGDWGILGVFFYAAARPNRVGRPRRCGPAQDQGFITVEKNNSQRGEVGPYRKWSPAPRFPALIFLPCFCVPSRIVGAQRLWNAPWPPRPPNSQAIVYFLTGKPRKKAF